MKGGECVSKKAFAVKEGGKRVKQLAFETIHKLANDYPIKTLCSLFRVSRSGYYAWKKRDGVYQKDVKDEKLFEIINKHFEKHYKMVGAERLSIILENEENIKVGKKQVARVMRKYGLYCVIRRKYRNYNNPAIVAPNLLEQNFTATKPRIKLAIDITYIGITQPYRKWAYLCAVKDLYNGEVLASTFGNKQNTQLVLNTVKKLKEKGLGKGAILHSDQGAQFTNRDYFQLLGQSNITPSMSRRGNCWDNAPIESFFSIIKEEMPIMFSYKTFEETSQAIEEYITYYNKERVVTKLRMSPQQYLSKFQLEVA
ncbi:IS3 family transposase [Oceanobacillus sp. CAU 1775]